MKNKRKKRKHFSHLEQQKRDRIEALRNEGHSQKEIAAILKVDPSTISREITKRKRKNGYYDSDTAQIKARVKRMNASYKGRKIEGGKELKKYIVAELKEKRSPDEISGRMRMEKKPFYASKNAIYAWLYSIWGQKYCRYLCSKRYRSRKQKRKSKREMIPNRIPLEQRPKQGEHAEGDLFVSPICSGIKKSGAIVCVPSAQLLSGTFIKNRRPVVMAFAVRKITAALSIRDITFDNGIENKEHEQFGLPAYFADPHSPWQKPHVENNIGLLRRWFIKKGTNLKLVSENQLQAYLHILNGKYRKSLGYKNAYEVALERGIIQKMPEITLNNLSETLSEKIAFHL
ncbi:IS30 family transposase [Candidatus Peregrinibacteria bacterium]|nr:IS30 family transposase [Candidatus Peregrinibacteria bacterium]